MYFALFYDYVPDVLERRAPLRAAHLALAAEHRDSGRLVMAGAFADPVDGALFVFRCPTRQDVEQFVASDPYVKNGLVTGHRIRDWTVVVGGEEGR